MPWKKSTMAATDSVQPAAASVSAPADAVAEETTRTALLIGAYPGTEAMMERIWKKFLDFGTFTVVTVTTDDLVSALSGLLRDGRLPDEFIFVPANTFPVAPIRRCELHTPLVYVGKDGRRTFAHRLPHVFNRSFLEECLAGTDLLPDEELCRRQVESSGFRPVEVGFTFGNYVCPVNRGNPCEHIVLEAFLRKKFVSASREGFAAIEELVRRLADS